MERVLISYHLHIYKLSLLSIHSQVIGSNIPDKCWKQPLNMIKAKAICVNTSNENWKGNPILRVLMTPLGFPFGVMKTFSNCMMVAPAQHCRLTKWHGVVQSQMVQMVNFTLCIFFHNKRTEIAKSLFVLTIKYYIFWGPIIIFLFGQLDIVLKFYFIFLCITDKHFWMVFKNDDASLNFSPYTWYS